MYQLGKPCAFCPHGDDPLFPNKVVLQGDGVTMQDLTCASMRDNLVTEDSTPSCFEAHQQLENSVGTEVYDFCGCSTEDLGFELCPTCPAGYELKSSDPTCTEWAWKLKSVAAGDQLCEILQNSAKLDCCVSLTESGQEVGGEGTDELTETISAFNQESSAIGGSIRSLPLIVVVAAAFQLL